MLVLFIFLYLKRFFQRTRPISQNHPSGRKTTIIQQHQPGQFSTHADFALLIDADNTSTEIFPQVMQKVEEAWGTVNVRQLYGNQEALLSQKWKDFCLQYALQPVPHVGMSGVKNATDIALTVGAMDLLHGSAIKKFCLVTGDQDFTALVLRLRRQGCQVYCIGRSAKSAALARVCTSFISLQQLSPSSIEAEEPVEASKPDMDQALTTLFIQAIDNIQAKKKVQGWVSVPLLGTYIKQLDPQFQAKAYGYKTLPLLVQARTDIFENRQHGDHLEVRLKPQDAG
jgi:uncharacterized protein (TIGR00288 family)